MPTTHGRFGRQAPLPKVAMISTIVALSLAFGLTVAWGILAAMEQPEAGTIIRCSLLALAELAVALGTIVLYSVLGAVANVDTSLGTLNAHMDRLEAILSASRNDLKRLADLAPLSDQAKAMIYREQELEAVRETVNACLVKQDYMQAEKLIDRMETQFGYQSEAARLRVAVAASREATVEGKVNAALEQVHQIIAQNNWPRALREAQRLVEAFPENENVRKLGTTISEARNRHKGQLLRQYDEAVRRKDVDASIDLLRELDRYLTPQEGAALQESARGVFRAKLHNLGVQFAIAVNDQRWDEAVSTGEQIIQGYPNSRMSVEVRQKLDALRQLATTSAGSDVGR